MDIKTISTLENFGYDADFLPDGFVDATNDDEEEATESAMEPAMDRSRSLEELSDIVGF